MKTFSAAAVGAISLLSTNGALAQGGYMMDGSSWAGHWMGRGFGGWWVPVLLVLLIGVVVWAVLQQRK